MLAVMREELKTFSDFDGLPPAVVEALAARARRLRVPARRWLVRPGRVLSGRFYLLEGRVQLIELGRSVIVHAGSARARRAIYPGAAGVETLTPAVFLNVDSALLEAAGGEAGGDGLGAPEVVSEEACWQRRFLSSPLMQHLAPTAWQRILRAMTRHDFAAGDTVIRAGERAACCYVLRAGTAAIRRGDETLARLTPGALFGEDALIRGGVRNADVIMTGAGSVMSLPAERFRAWLLDVVVRPVTAPDGRVRLALDATAEADVRLSVDELRDARWRLAAAEQYVVVGAGAAERALAAFLLAEQGIDARPLASAGGAVRPARCGPGPSA